MPLCASTVSHLWIRVRPCSVQLYSTKARARPTSSNISFFRNISSIFCCYSPAENTCRPQRSGMAALAHRNALGSCIPSTPGVPPQRCHTGNSAVMNPAISKHQFGCNAFSFWYKRRHKACTSGWEPNEVKKVSFFSMVYTEGTEDWKWWTKRGKSFWRLIEAIFYYSAWLINHRIQNLLYRTG